MMKRLFALFVVIFVTGCGFRPLYYTGSEPTSVQKEQQKIFIDEIQTRQGQILRRHLLSALNPEGEVKNPKYRLSVNLHPFTVSELGTVKDGLATRYRITYRLNFKLLSYPEGKVLLQDNLSVFSSYDVLQSPYSSNESQEVMSARLMQTLGTDISIRVSAYLKRIVNEEK